MKILIDINILIRIDHEVVVNTLADLKKQQANFYILPQVLIEFWCVATRPKNKNGLGYSVTETENEVQKAKKLFHLFPDKPEYFAEWQRLVKNYEVKGVNVHDTRLVAAMIVNQLTHIVTFNGQDFRRYQEITIIDPKTYLISSP